MALKKNSTKSPTEKRSSSLNISNPKVYEMIRKRAYDIYVRRGYSHGNDQHDWFEAERQVKREVGVSR